MPGYTFFTYSGLSEVGSTMDGVIELNGQPVSILLFQSLSCVQLCDPMGCNLPGSSLSMGFPRQEYRSGLPFPSPGDHLTQG